MDQNAVTEASYRIDRALARDPKNQGEERLPDRRVMFESPLIVIYRIDKSKKSVVVLNCRQY